MLPDNSIDLPESNLLGTDESSPPGTTLGLTGLSVMIDL
jgi:hypothetical protein